MDTLKPKMAREQVLAAMMHQLAIVDCCENTQKRLASTERKCAQLVKSTRGETQDLARLLLSTVRNWRDGLQEIQGSVDATCKCLGKIVDAESSSETKKKGD